MLEFDSELCDDFEAMISETNDFFVEAGNAFDVLEAYTPEDQSKLWKLRKAAIPLLMSLEGDPKPYPFIEDATVPRKSSPSMSASLKTSLKTTTPRRRISPMPAREHCISARS